MMSNSRKPKRGFYFEIYAISKKEIEKSLGIKERWIQLSVALLVLFIILYKLYGIKYAMETVSTQYWINIFELLILSFFVPIFAIVRILWVIPREYRKKQTEIKNLEKMMKSEVVEANVLLLPISLNSDRVYALLRVKNNEKSKEITNCRAKITNFFMSHNDAGDLLDFTGSITAMENPFFYWQKNHDKQIDIGYSDEEILCVAVEKENNFLHLSELKDEYDFHLMTSSNGKRFYEIRFRIELSGTIGNKNQVFYKAFLGKVFFSSISIVEENKNIIVNDIDFSEIIESELVENF